MKKFFRNITVDDVVYWYHIGQGKMKLRHPSGKSTTHCLCDVKGMGFTPDTVDRGRWKKTTDGMITPGEVARFIQSHVLIEEAVA